MKKLLQTLILLLVALMVPAHASADYVQLADGVYQDGTTLYIGSGVTSLGTLQLNPSVIYSYATIPPSLLSTTFANYNAEVHVPAAAMVAYFTTVYWYSFNNITADAVEPQSVTINKSAVEMECDGTVSLNATVTPSNATPSTVYWSSTNTDVASVNGGRVIAVGAGECDIVATCVDKQAVCHVTVVPQRVTITLNKHVARLLPNHTMTLTAACTPPTTDLVVSTSDPTVAIPRYVNGTIMVVGVGEGTANITVNTADGWANPDTCEVTVYTLLGDVNSDGFVDINDVTILINRVLGNDEDNFIVAKADVYQDGSIDINDVTRLINHVLGVEDINAPKTETFTVNGVSFTMVNVEGGTFIMGASDDDSEAYEFERPAHEVTLSSYAIGQTEVTQALWQAVMGSNPSEFTPTNGYAENLSRPVDLVCWDDCQEFILRLNAVTGKQFRLPTEAEWEYAARGGNRSNGNQYSGSNIINDVAWYYGNSFSLGESSPDYGTHAVATKLPNELGLYDMSGNVWEWCQDRDYFYCDMAQTNPTGPVSAASHMYRGGAWSNDARESRISFRFPIGTLFVNGEIGLRLAIDMDNSPKFRLSETVITVVVGENESIGVLNGNGSYTVAGGAEYVTATTDGNNLIVTGTSVGTTTVHVTDNATGATAVLVVVVKEPEIQTKTFTVNGVSFKMIAVEGGTFTMGAREGDSEANWNEKPAHEVMLSSYYIGETEVTQALWQAVMFTNPSYFSGDLNRPVERVSWDDCQTFISKLNLMTGKHFRLPTESEWEYAARGGKESHGYKYSGSNTIGDVAWYMDNSRFGNFFISSAVASKSPNELGIYDMSGNVFEWCQDWYGSYSNVVQTNPTGPISGTERVCRGGSCVDEDVSCRVSKRGKMFPSDSDCVDIGLRLAL